MGVGGAAGPPKKTDVEETLVLLQEKVDEAYVMV